MPANTLRPRQNCRHSADEIFKCSFLNDNVLIWIKISLKFVPGCPINNIPALVQIMAWRWPGDKPLSEPTMVWLSTHIYASLGLNELKYIRDAYISIVTTHDNASFTVQNQRLLACKIFLASLHLIRKIVMQFRFDVRLLLKMSHLTRSGDIHLMATLKEMSMTSRCIVFEIKSSYKHVSLRWAKYLPHRNVYCRHNMSWAILCNGLENLYCYDRLPKVLQISQLTRVRNAHDFHMNAAFGRGDIYPSLSSWLYIVFNYFTKIHVLMPIGAILNVDNYLE